jgi:uncharacterized iron-regulated membrane protein
VLALLSFTGIWLAYPDAARNLLGAAPRTVQAPEPAAGGKPVGLEAAVNAARTLYPSARVTGLGVPAGPRGVYRVNLRSGEDAVAVFIDPASGSVLRRADPATRGAGERFLAAIRQLHAGEGFGLGRIILFLAGLLPAILAVSGALIWLRAKRAERFR